MVLIGFLVCRPSLFGLVLFMIFMLAVAPLIVDVLLFVTGI